MKPAGAQGHIAVSGGVGDCIVDSDMEDRFDMGPSSALSIPGPVLPRDSPLPALERLPPAQEQQHTEGLLQPHYQLQTQDSLQTNVSPPPQCQSLQGLQDPTPTQGFQGRPSLTTKQKNIRIEAKLREYLTQDQLKFVLLEWAQQSELIKQGHPATPNSNAFRIAHRLGFISEKQGREANEAVKFMSPLPPAVSAHVPTPAVHQPSTTVQGEVSKYTSHADQSSFQGTDTPVHPDPSPSAFTFSTRFFGPLQEHQMNRPLDFASYHQPQSSSMEADHPPSPISTRFFGPMQEHQMNRPLPWNAPINDPRIPAKAGGFSTPVPNLTLGSFPPRTAQGTMPPPIVLPHRFIAPAPDSRRSSSKQSEEQSPFDFGPLEPGTGSPASQQQQQLHHLSPSFRQKTDIESDVSEESTSFQQKQHERSQFGLQPMDVSPGSGIEHPYFQHQLTSSPSSLQHTGFASGSGASNHGFQEQKSPPTAPQYMGFGPGQGVGRSFSQQQQQQQESPPIDPQIMESPRVSALEHRPVVMSQLPSAAPTDPRNAGVHPSIEDLKLPQVPVVPSTCMATTSMSMSEKARGKLPITQPQVGMFSTAVPPRPNVSQASRQKKAALNTQLANRVALDVPRQDSQIQDIPTLSWPPNDHGPYFPSSYTTTAGPSGASKTPPPIRKLPTLTRTPPMPNLLTLSGPPTPPLDPLMIEESSPSPSTSALLPRYPVSPSQELPGHPGMYRYRHGRVHGVSLRHIEQGSRATPLDAELYHGDSLRAILGLHGTPAQNAQWESDQLANAGPVEQEDGVLALAHEGHLDGSLENALGLLESCEYFAWEDYVVSYDEYPGEH